MHPELYRFDREVERVLRALHDGDWYVDEDNQAWVWCYDIDTHIHRWFLDDAYTLELYIAGREHQDLRGATRQLRYYGWNDDGLWLRDSAGPYRRVSRPEVSIGFSQDPRTGEWQRNGLDFRVERPQASTRTHDRPVALPRPVHGGLGGLELHHDGCDDYLLPQLLMEGYRTSVRPDRPA